MTGRRTGWVLGVAAVLVASLLPTATATAGHGWSSGVDSWITDLHTGQRLAKQRPLRWRAGDGGENAIVVDSTRRYQAMAGFGASMTDSSAYVLSGLPPRVRKSIMTELFSARDGIGLSMLRQPMGASDFAVGTAYSYDDQPAGQTDPDLSDFSIDHDRRYILPRLREAYRINPRLSFMATPWSPPGWMKTTDSMITGSLRPEYQQTYAQYFVKFIRAYAKAGIPTDYVSMQNEPLYEPADYPGMWVLPDQAAVFLGRDLGPALAAAGLDDTTILAYDQNWDIPDYPEAIYHGLGPARPYVPGTAWHCYAGQATGQSVSHNNYPHAQAFLTECSGGAWQGTADEAFEHTMDAVIGSPRNWGQSVILWNLALDERHGPRIGGCDDCRGLVTVHDDGSVTKNLDFWALGHASRFVAPGAVRIGSSQPAGSPVSNVAYANRDGSLVLIAHNAGRQAQTYDIVVGDRHVRAALAPGAAASYRFRAPATLPPAGDLGWLDLDFGPGPAGTPSGRLTASVGPEVVAAISQVRLGDGWLAYSLPYGATLQRTTATDLDRRGWRLEVAGTTPVEGQERAKMLDGNLATRWSSGESQDTDMSLTVDLGSRQTFTELSMNVGESIGDYPRSYLVQTSDDGVSWRSVARGPGRTGELIIALPETTARYVRVANRAQAVSPWSIAELNIRRADLSGGGAPIAGELISDGGRLADGSTVVGYLNDSPTTQTVPWPITGFGYDYRLPPGAVATFVVLT